MQKPDRKKPLLIWGARGHSRVLKDCLDLYNQTIVAMVDRDPKCRNPFLTVPLMHTLAQVQEWLSKQTVAPDFLVAIGGQRGADRLHIALQLEQLGLSAHTLIHPTAVVAVESSIGIGSQILALSHIAAGSSIGRQTIINHKVNVDHECRIGDGVHLAPGVTLAGEVVILNNATVFTGACIAPGVEIGEGAVIGAGSVVINHIPAYSLAYGNPAKVIRQL
jgi:sugar O-acyltransferase (sialic acid O-acetyltransferase NeuD family)